MKFGLDEKSAARLTIKHNLSTVTYEALQMMSHHRKLLKRSNLQTFERPALLSSPLSCISESFHDLFAGIATSRFLFPCNDTAQQSQEALGRNSDQCTLMLPCTHGRFLRPSAVYVKSVVDWHLFKSVASTYMYAGATSVRVASREPNRMSHTRRFSHGREKQADLAIRYWPSSGLLCIHHISGCYE